MDLYAPITNALANTQSTIVDLMKTFMSNEIAKQGLELEREKLGQSSRGLDLEAQRNTLAVQKEQTDADRLRAEREDRLRARTEDVTFRNDEATRAATAQGNAFELQKGGQAIQIQGAADTRAHQKEVVGIQRENLGLEKGKFNQQYGKTTIGQIGEQMGIDPFVWGFMDINKDAPTTPERFQQMVSRPDMLYKLPRAAVVRHSEQLKTIEKQILIEKDPAKKEQMKTNKEALYSQVNILRDAIERGPDKGLITSVIKGMGITDPEEAATAMETITNRWKGMQDKAFAATIKPPPDPADPAASQEITSMLQDIKAGKYDLTPAQMKIIQNRTSNVKPQDIEAVRGFLTKVLKVSQKPQASSFVDPSVSLSDTIQHY